MQTIKKDQSTSAPVVVSTPVKEEPSEPTITTTPNLGTQVNPLI